MHTTPDAPILLSFFLNKPTFSILKKKSQEYIPDIFCRYDALDYIREIKLAKIK